MTSKNLLITVDGIDGVGKTTCTRLLTEKMQAVYYKTPSDIFERVRADIEVIGNVQVRFNFYLTATLYDSVKIGKLLSGQNVICDRYIYSTIAYHQALGCDLSYFNLDQLPIVFPDYAFYLFAREEVCRQRMNNRSNLSSSDINLENNLKLQRQIHQEFLKLSMIKINTSYLDPDGVCEHMLKFLKEV